MQIYGKIELVLIKNGAPGATRDTPLLHFGHTDLSLVSFRGIFHCVIYQCPHNNQHTFVPITN